jgi:hypothetical protein
MAVRCRAFDWAATPLGPVDSWSQSARPAAAEEANRAKSEFLAI